MAYDGTYIYYNDGPDFGNNEIYVLNSTTGAVVNSYLPNEPYYLWGIAYLDGNLWATDSVNLYELNPTNGNVIQEFASVFPSGNVTGLTADPANGMLYAVSQYNELYEIDPTTGAIVNSAPDNAQGLNEQDMAFANGLLIVSDTNGLAYEGGTNVLDEYDPNTLAFVARVPVPVYGFVSGLAGDGLGGAPPDDYYSIDVQAGQALYLQTSTPSDQGGQFPNTASLEISLYDTYGNLVAVGTKLPDGRNEALFFNAPISGQYTIEISEDPGGQGEYYLSATTASYPSGGASGQVYNDLNGSGTYNSGDPGLSGWEVDLFNSSGDFVASQETDSNGDFSFGGLDPGTYTVEEVVQAGWTQTAPPTVTFTVTVTAGSTVTGLQFGNFQDINVSGEVYNDLNGNGTLDPGDPGLPGWTVDLYDSNGNLIATTTSDANGDYSFSDLGPGTYTVEEILPAGWIQTAPAPPGTYTFSATSGQNVVNDDFGNFELVTYSGTVYNDLNRQRCLQSERSGPGGLDGRAANRHDCGRDDHQCLRWKLLFRQCELRRLHDRRDHAGRLVSDGARNPVRTTRTATSGASQSGLNFGNFQLVDVTGNVYNDLNGNGNLDPGEPGLQGWTVILEDPSGNIVATTTSDANGNYEFDNLFPGTFIVDEVLQSGWTQTQPVNPDYYEFTTQSGLDETGLNFGNVMPATFTGTVYNDLSGDGVRVPADPVLSGWTIDLFNSVSATLVATTTSNSSGQYTFTNVTSGVYTIEEIVQSGWFITEPTNPPGTYTLTATSGGDVTGLDFGNFKLITVSGDIYNDLNGNGLRGAGEPGLAGWTVDLEDSQGNILATQLTDRNGNY